MSMNEQAIPRGEHTDSKQPRSLPRYRERRRYRRVDLDLPAVIRTSDRRVLKGRVSNISSDGVQLRCDAETARTLHQEGTAVPRGDGPSVLLGLDLQHGHGAPQPVTLTGQLRYVARVRPQEVAFGMQFTDLKFATKTLLDRFFLGAAQPSG